MSEWIKVTDRLPEIFDTYYVYPSGKYSGSFVEFWTFEDFKGHKKNTFEWTNSDDDVFQVDVTHWMPIPAPPIAED
jgi:hypothetical protein